MKVGIIGASGKAGRLIMTEALGRGLDVTAIVRNPNKITEQNVSILQKDLFDLTANDLAGFDVVVDAFNAPQGQEAMHQTSLAHLLTILKGNTHTRLLIVGGAGTLYVDKAHQMQLVDTPDFNTAYLPVGRNMRDAYRTLNGLTSVKWTYVTPAAAFLADGEKTGSYQLGGDEMLLNSEGASMISYADYAIAMVDEIEQGQHICERISVASK